MLIAAMQKRKAAVADLAKQGAALSNAGYALAEHSALESDLSFAIFRADRALQSSISAASIFRSSGNPADAETAIVEFSRYTRELAAISRLDAEGKLQASLKVANAKLPLLKTALDGVVNGAGEIDVAYQSLKQTGDVLIALGSEARSQAVKQQEQIMSAMSVDAGQLRQLVLGISAIALVIGGLLAWRVGRGVSQPLVMMTQAMQRLAGGDFTVAIPATLRRDETRRNGAGCSGLQRRLDCQADGRRSSCSRS
ncbi:HAMP domain-containing protein [Methylobacterium sp. P31]